MRSKFLGEGKHVLSAKREDVDPARMGVHGPERRLVPGGAFHFHSFRWCLPSRSPSTRFHRSLHEGRPFHTAESLAVRNRSVFSRLPPPTRHGSAARSTSSRFQNKGPRSITDLFFQDSRRCVLEVAALRRLRVWGIWVGDRSHSV